LPFAKEFTYQGLRVFPNVYLAPMEGVTDPSFRRLCKRLAGGRMGMLVSEFVSIEGLTRFNPKTEEKTRFYPEEMPFTVQIFGAEPERMAWAAKRVEESGAAAVEINCGCPVPKVVKKGGGSGLLKDLPLLAELCTAVRNAVSIPCSIKVRVGWADDHVTIFETVKIAQDCGMGLIVIHGRTRAQGYKGWANWDLIGEAKSRASIPVVGNGDITTWQGAIDRLQRYGVDGVIAGRGAMHNPWMFAQIADFYEGKTPVSPTVGEHREVLGPVHERLSRSGHGAHGPVAVGICQPVPGHRRCLFRVAGTRGRRRLGSGSHSRTQWQERGRTGGRCRALVRVPGPSPRLPYIPPPFDSAQGTAESLAPPAIQIGP
jgi:nifR3 family TIM-barrel protein